MGLDGISLNQLRVTPEFNSAELNNHLTIASESVKAVDGLANGQRVDPDKEKEHEQNNPEASNSENEENTDEEEVQEEVAIEKYDLSDEQRYLLRLDDKSNKIVIYLCRPLT